MKAPRILSASCDETPQARTVSYHWPTPARVLGKNIFRVCEPALISAYQSQIPAVQADYRGRCEVISRRQCPINVSSEECVVARMVVKVRDKGIETNAAEKFPSVFLRLRDDATQLLDKKHVRPSLSCVISFV